MEHLISELIYVEFVMPSDFDTLTYYMTEDKYKLTTFFTLSLYRYEYARIIIFFK